MKLTVEEKEELHKALLARTKFLLNSSWSEEIGGITALAEAVKALCALEMLDNPINQFKWKHSGDSSKIKK